MTHETPDFSQYPNTERGSCYVYDPATGLRIPDIVGKNNDLPEPDHTVGQSLRGPFDVAHWLAMTNVRIP